MPRASAAAAAGHRAGSPLPWRTRDSDRRSGCPIAPTTWRSGCSAPARRPAFRAASFSRRCPRWPVERSVEPPRAMFPSPCSGWASTWRTARRSGCWRMRAPACRISPAGWKKTAASFWGGADVPRASLDPIWPEPSGTPDGTELVHRWEALFGKAPRLRPWVDQMLGRHRLRLTESGAAAVEVERTLWLELSRWLVDSEALPEFAVSANAVTLEDEAAHEVDPGSADDDELAPSLTPSPYQAFVAAAAKSRVALADASGLCSRIAASARARPGGLALVGADSAPPASPEELGALFRNMRKYGHMGGFRQLLSLL